MAVNEAELDKHIADLKLIDQHVKAQSVTTPLTEPAVMTMVEIALPTLNVTRLCVIGRLSQAQLDALNGLREERGLGAIKRKDVGILSKRLPHIYAARIFRDATPWGDLKRTYRLALSDTSTVSMESRPDVGVSSLLISGVSRQNYLSQVVIDRAVGSITRNGMFELRTAYGKK